MVVTAQTGQVRAAARDLDVAAWVSWGVVAAVAASSVVLRVLDVDWSGAQTALVVGGLLVALPHGAVDHLAPRWRESRRTVPLVPLMLGYAALAAVAWAVLRTWPLFGLVVLLVLSVVHFGFGEATFHTLRSGPAPGSALRAAGLGVGLVAVLLPILTHAREAAPYLHVMAPGWDGRLGPAWEAALVAAVLAVALLTALAALLCGHRVVAAEVVLLVVLAVAAPPAVAVATYVGWWHAVRHTAVLVTEERAVTGSRALRSLAVRAAAPTLAAALTLAGLWWWAGGDALSFVSEQIWLLAALTVPHGLVVAWLDRTRASDLVGVATPAQPDPH
ncbi:beta-carotene 15,15'-dioxygenase, Brp/Blh family [Nocardioides rubriscoriae]|uniref:beta-carotene 15,15'-dioxygenase, Brp/Blh family n=1 Tax=Nocardioides rubriscoriae TaxID=642762 RepID=UPI0011DF543D|nr:beta-carotene 15,15'-dioxygenase, Brp/Blh family [Nocardioides rubriscoriae]